MSAKTTTDLAAENLKQQFEALQAQQQKKLARQKQKKDEVKKKSASVKSGTASSMSFGIDDNLDLKLADPPVPTNSIYSEELVEHLNQQIREMKDETGRLYKLLSERDFELRKLRRKQEDQEQCGVGGLSNETAATKIVELSKKIRELNSDLQSEKTKSKQLTKKCVDLENQVKNGGGTKGNVSSRSYDQDDRASEVDIRQLQDRLKQSELKVAELRNQVQASKQDLKVAQKVIEQEVGEGHTLASLMNQSNGWRGRAQQIVTLQRKVNELKSEIEIKPPPKRDLDEDDLEAQFMGSASSRRPTASSMNDRYQSSLRKMEKERKEQQERMANELKALEADYEELKKKWESSKARNKSLSGEVKSFKQQMKTLLEKGKHDDELIDALLKQQNKLKQAVEDSTKKQRHLEEKDQQKQKQTNVRSQQETNLVEQLQQIVSEKETKVHALEEEINQMKLANIQKAQMNGVNQLFEQQRPPSTQRNRPPSANMEVEDFGTMTPPPPVSRHPTELPQDPEPVLSDRPSSRRAPSRSNSAIAGDQKQLQELRMQCQEYKSLCQAATVERDKLSELVQLLQKRIDECTTQVTDAVSEVQSHKRRNVQLEKQLGKARVESGTTQSARRTKSIASLQAIEEHDNNLPNDVEELQTRLDIQKDENEALKAALQSTLKAKEEDMRLYAEMIDQTKQIFLQGLRQFRQT